MVAVVDDDVAGDCGGSGCSAELWGVNWEGPGHLGRVCHHLDSAGQHCRVLLMIFIVTGCCDVVFEGGCSRCGVGGQGVCWGAIGSLGSQYCCLRGAGGSFGARNKVVDNVVGVINGGCALLGAM